MQPASETQAESYDAVMVGASFAGLSFASVAAARGLRGLVLERDAPVLDARRDADGWMSITYRAPEPNDGQAGGGPISHATARARIVIGADGARSLVAQRMGLDQNQRFLAGAEWLVENVALDGETFYLVMDHALAP